MPQPAAARATPPRPRLRRLVAPFVAPEVFDFWASRVRRTWSWSRPLARVVARTAASEDSVTLTLAPNRHVGALRAGQHLEVSADIDGVRVGRRYSPTPRPDGRLEITVKRIEGGRLSRHLCDEARIGDVLALGPAEGGLVLPEAIDGRWVFLAAGSGITPLLAMLRELAARDMPVPLELVYWTRTRAQRCFGDELRELARRYPHFRVRFGLTREAAIDADEFEGRIDAAHAVAPGADGPQVYACGPAAFVAAAQAKYAGRARLFRAEAFTPPSHASCDEGEVEVRLARSGRVLSLPRGQSLLVALEDAGLKPAHGCRMGICNTCACAASEGAVRHLPTGAIAEAPMSALKLCVHAALHPLVIDL